MARRLEPTHHRRKVNMTIKENADCTAVEQCQAGGQGQVLASIMPRAQNRTAEKGSTLK